jgi:hypothetical protein
MHVKVAVIVFPHNVTLRVNPSRKRTPLRRSRYIDVRSIGVMSTPKRTARPTAFSEAADFLCDAIKAAREAELPRVRDSKETDTEQAKAANPLFAPCSG